MRTKNRIAAIAGSVAIMSAGLIAGAAPASALPTGCEAHAYSNGGYARCSGGTGQVRAVVACGQDPVGTYRYGPWVGINLNSIVFCSNAVGAFYQRRG